MDRRAMIGVLGAGAAGLLATSGRAFAADDKMHDEKHDAMMADCLKACAECAKACDEAYHHCLMEVSKGKETGHGWTLQMVGDCGILCGVSAGMIARHSPLMADSCMATAMATKKTLAHIERHDSPEMKSLGSKLMACEKSCTMMVAEAKEHHEKHMEMKKKEEAKTKA